MWKLDQAGRGKEHRVLAEATPRRSIALWRREGRVGHTDLIPGHRKQRQADLHESKASQVYSVSFSMEATKGDLVF